MTYLICVKEKFIQELVDYDVYVAISTLPKDKLPIITMGRMAIIDYSLI